MSYRDAPTALLHAALLLGLTALSQALVVPPPTVIVRVGYFKESQPILVGAAFGWYDTTIDGTRFKFEFIPQASGGRVVKKLDNRELDIAALGSSPWAYAISRGVPITHFYTLHSKGTSQGLVVRSGSGMTDPFKLVGRAIAMPSGSTAHFHILFLVDVFHLPWHICDSAATCGSVSKLNVWFLPPNTIQAKWDDNTIDGAFIWGGVKDHILNTGGEMLISANDLCCSPLLGATGGRETFNNVVVTNTFAAAHPKLLAHTTRIFTLLDELYLSSPSSFGVSTEYLRTIASLCLRDVSASAWPTQAIATLAGKLKSITHTHVHTHG